MHSDPAAGPAFAADCSFRSGEAFVGKTPRPFNLITMPKGVSNDKNYWNFRKSQEAFL